MNPTRRIWHFVRWLSDRTRWRLVYPVGRAVDRVDRALLRLGWYAERKADPQPDGIPF